MSLLPPLASIGALEARLGLEEGALEGAELDRAMACLVDASIIVRYVSQRDWIELDDEGEPVLGDDGEPVVNAPQILVKITRDVARRMFTNPDAEVQEGRSEEHTSELQSRENLVCRLLLEKKKILIN